MEVENIQEVMSRLFGGECSARGRLFMACVTGEEILLFTDSRKPSKLVSPMHVNVFVPMLCRRCQGSKDNVAGLKLSYWLLRSWGVFEAVRDWCGYDVEVVREVADREAIMQQCKMYDVQIQGAEVKSRSDGGLEIVPHFDTGLV